MPWCDPQQTLQFTEGQEVFPNAIVSGRMVLCACGPCVYREQIIGILFIYLHTHLFVFSTGVFMHYMSRGTSKCFSIYVKM